MRFVITLLSVAAFALHMLWGCCAHHAHGAMGESCVSQSLSNQHATHHGHAHDHCAPEASELQPAENSDRGEQHDDCHESHCTFLAADETSFLLEEPVAALPLIACDTTTSQATAISIRWLADTGDPLRLPVRLHLYHEVFLN